MIAFFKERLLLIVFLIVGLIGALIAIVWMMVAIIFAPSGTRAIDIALSLDRLFNSATGGNGKETLSSRAGRLSIENTKWACTLCVFLDWLQTDHCKNSIGS